jgi:diguanylate cyclase
MPIESSLASRSEQDVLSFVSDLAQFRPPPGTAVLGAVVGYGVVCALVVVSAAPEGGGPLLLLLAGWILGLGVMLFLEHTPGRVLPGALIVAKALWINVGLVTSALFAPPGARVLLLTVPLLGVLYAALHLSRRHVGAVTLVTWAIYLIGILAADGAVPNGGLTEVQLAVVFSLMLLAMFFMAGEVVALRDAFERRRQRLDGALQKLSDLVMRDDLTGIYNRRYIMDVLTRQKALADRGNVGFTLCYCDLDHFKRINDRFGHQRGDDVLREFAGLAERVVRSVDYVARFGGEEFLLVLIGADAHEAERVVARLAERTRRLAVHPHYPDHRLTVSVGIAEFRPGESVEDVIQRADRALYRAKSAGRDVAITA